MTQGEDTLNTTMAAPEATNNAEERAERYVGKTETQMINSARAQKGALTRFGHQVQNLLTTLTATPNRTTLQRIKEVQKKIEDKWLDIEAVQHALIDICEQNPDKHEKFFDACYKRYTEMTQVIDERIALVALPERDVTAPNPAAVCKPKEELKPGKLTLEFTPREWLNWGHKFRNCLLYTSPSPRDGLLSRMPSSA